MAGIEQTKTDAVQAVQNAQTTATTAITQTKDAALTDIGNAKTGALQEVANSTATAETAASAAAGSASDANASEEAASAAASAAAGSASTAATKAREASTSRQAAEKAQKAAEDAAALAGTRAGTDKTLSIENAPADAKATGDALAGKADKSTVQDENGNAIFTVRLRWKLKSKKFSPPSEKKTSPESKSGSATTPHPRQALSAAHGSELRENLSWAQAIPTRQGVREVVRHIRRLRVNSRLIYTAYVLRMLMMENIPSRVMSGG